MPSSLLIACCQFFARPDQPCPVFVQADLESKISVAEDGHMGHMLRSREGALTYSRAVQEKIASGDAEKTKREAIAEQPATHPAHEGAAAIVFP